MEPASAPSALADSGGDSDGDRLAAGRHSSVRPRFGEPGRPEKEGANLSRPRDHKATNLYNEGDDANSLVLELAFGRNNCFADVVILCIDASPGGARTPASRTPVAAAPAPAPGCAIVNGWRALATIEQPRGGLGGSVFCLPASWPPP